MDTNYQLNNQSLSGQFVQQPYPKPIESIQRKMIISLVVGIIVALAGLFTLLAACQILPNGVNVISQWHVGSMILSTMMIVAGASAIIYGLFQAHQSRRMMEIYARVSNSLQSRSDISNEDLTEYLTIKIRDGKFDAIKDTFAKLNLDSQGKLLAIASEEGNLTEVMDQIPKNIKRLKIGLGKKLNFDRACDLADQFVSKLNDFKELEHIALDLSGVAYYTHRVHNHTERMLQAIYDWGDVNFGGYNYEPVNLGGVITLNNAAAAERAMTGLLKYMKNNPITSADIQFKDHLVAISKVNSLSGPRLVITKIAGKLRNEMRSYN